MLTRLDGAKYPHHGSIETHQAEVESMLADRGVSTRFRQPSRHPAERADTRHTAIEPEAYRLADRRGLEPGLAEQDWLEAKARMDLSGGLGA